MPDGVTDQTAYKGSGHEDTPTIDDVKALQARIHLTAHHVVWLGEGQFVIAHTDEERATIDLETCELHQRLMLADSSPVSKAGYYMWFASMGEFGWLGGTEIGVADAPAS